LLLASFAGRFHAAHGSLCARGGAARHRGA